MLSLIGGSVSLLFSLLIFFTMILFRKYRQCTQRVIFYLTVSVSLSSLAYVLHGARLGRNLTDDAYCMGVAFLDQVTGWMVLLAVCCLTLDLFIKVVFIKFDTGRFEPIYCLVIFAIPLTFNWIPFVTQAYGPSGAICWIRETKRTNCTELDYGYVSLRIFLYWLPFTIILLAIILAYCVIFAKTRKQLKAYSGNFNPVENTTRQLLYHEVRWYLIYPVLLLFSYIGAIILRVAEVINTEEKFFTLRIIHVLAISLQGVAMALVFALDYDTRKQLIQYNSVKAACYNLFCCWKQREVTEYEAIRVPTDSLNSKTTSNKTMNQNSSTII